jgi:hypothetical protein
MWTPLCASTHQQITRYSIYTQASERQPNIFVRGKANLAGAIKLGIEVVIICPHAMKNIQKQLSGHPILTTKCICVVNPIGMVEIFSHEASVSTESISVFVVHALHRRPTSALRQQRMVVRHACSGDQEFGPVVGLLVRRCFDDIVVEKVD